MYNGNFHCYLDEDEVAEADEETVDEPINADDIFVPGTAETPLSPNGTCGTVFGSKEKHIIFGEEAAPEVHEQAKDSPSEPQTLFELSVDKKLGATPSDLDSKSRAAAIVEKLKEVFNIDQNDVFIAGYPCWLLKDILLQGHIYLTQRHLLFLAFLGQKSYKDKISLAGNISIEALPAPRLVRYWAVLKGSTFSLYNKSTDLYFPLLTVDLRYALKAELMKPNFTLNGKVRWFRILTENKSYKFQADSEHTARSWVTLLKKHIFTSRNKGDCVTLKIPLQNIIDTDLSPIFDSAETLKVKVVEGPTSYAFDDYFFMFFKSGSECHMSLNEAIQANIGSNVSTPDDIVDSTVNLSMNEKKPKNNILMNVFRKSDDSSSSVSDLVKAKTMEEPVVEKYIKRDTSNLEGPPLTSEGIPEDDDDDTSVLNKLASAPGKTFTSAKYTIGKWTPKVFKSAGTMWAANPVHYDEKNALERGDEDEFLAEPEERIASTQRFHTYFSLPEDELLVSAYHAYLNRNVPVYGKIYLGSKVICFRSLLPGTHTKMILPFKDVENCYKEKGFKFGYYGLVVVIHGHEELFFEFSSAVSRDDCEHILLKQLDKFRTPSESASIESSQTLNSTGLSSSVKIENAKIKMFEDKIHSAAGLDVPVLIEDHPLLKTSIRTGQPLRFSLLTIGSRGDVQPYIALGLGLKKEGHEVTIITHKEFQEWINKHGLLFKEIAGNPTELMSLMVTHGSMNVGLLKEASSKFRGWIKEVLTSSWEACQDTEILIESPSAMAGIHIAEALGIPYFRAFTMPWTRTRAYPHAFIVPDQKKGGSYNYLTHVLFENIFWKGTSGQINKWRKETLGLQKTNLDLLQQNKVPFLYNVSPTVMPPPVDYSDWVTVTGYWFLDEAVTYEPKQELIDFMFNARKDGKKLVYIGFGSIVVSNPKELTQAVVDAVVDADVRCILNKGWSERLGGTSEVEVQLPAQIYNSGAIPHDWLFPQIDAAVHHGGSGTTGATLRAGLPTIIKPFFADQFFYASRMEDIGAGIALKKLNVKSLSKALKEATTNQRMITKANSIGEKIRKEDGVSTAITNIYRELQYARDLSVGKKKANNHLKYVVPKDETNEISTEDMDKLHQQLQSTSSGVNEDKDSWCLV